MFVCSGSKLECKFRLASSSRKPTDSIFYCIESNLLSYRHNFAESKCYILGMHRFELPYSTLFCEKAHSSIFSLASCLTEFSSYFTVFIIRFRTPSMGCCLDNYYFIRRRLSSVLFLEVFHFISRDNFSSLDKKFLCLAALTLRIFFKSLLVYSLNINKFN